MKIPYYSYAVKNIPIVALCDNFITNCKTLFSASKVSPHAISPLTFSQSILQPLYPKFFTQLTNKELILLLSSPLLKMALQGPMMKKLISQCMDQAHAEIAVNLIKLGTPINIDFKFAHPWTRYSIKRFCEFAKKRLPDDMKLKLWKLAKANYGIIRQKWWRKCYVVCPLCLRTVIQHDSNNTSLLMHTSTKHPEISKRKLILYQ